MVIGRINNQLRTGETVLDLQALPEGCIANIISLTTPRDACRLSSVSKIFRSVAESDAVWNKFLPRDIHTILSWAVHVPQLSSSSKKELYLLLCDNPILMYNGMVSLSLDKWSGKKCYMMPARALLILGSSTPQFWRWISLPDSRFGEVAELLDVLCLEITGKIITLILSPSSLYKAYLVFKLTERAYGFEGQPVRVKVAKYFEVTPTKLGVKAREQTMFLDREKRKSFWQRISETRALQPGGIGEAKYLRERADGWMEIELGEFSHERDEELLKMSCVENSSDDFKSGLIVQGIEIRSHFEERPTPRQGWQFLPNWARLGNKGQSYSYWFSYFVGLTLLLIVLEDNWKAFVIFFAYGCLHPIPNDRFISNL